MWEECHCDSSNAQLLDCSPSTLFLILGLERFPTTHSVISVKRSATFTSTHTYIAFHSRHIHHLLFDHQASPPVIPLHCSPHPSKPSPHHDKQPPIPGPAPPQEPNPSKKGRLAAQTPFPATSQTGSKSAPSLTALPPRLTHSPCGEVEDRQTPLGQPTHPLGRPSGAPGKEKKNR